MDLYQKFRPKASQHQLVWIGRVATTILVVIGIAWIPVIQGAKGLYYYLQSVQGYLAPPIFVVFFLGVFFKRLNAKGCLAALIVGFALGVFRLAVDTPASLGLAGLAAYPEGSLLWIVNKVFYVVFGYYDHYPEGSFLWIVHNIYFQYFSLLIFLICVAVMVGVSYLTAAPSEAQLKGLTFATTSAEDRAKSRASWNRWDVLASLAVLALILAAYLYFRG
jgi:SSS family solute:Na+ symporter